VVADAVLGPAYGKLLRLLALETGAKILLGDRRSADFVVLAGDAVNGPRPNDAVPLLFLAPAKIGEDQARAILGRKRRILLLLPEIDEDGRSSFWRGIAEKHPRDGLVCRELGGVGTRVDWAWKQVMDHIREQTKVSGNRRVLCKRHAADRIFRSPSCCIRMAFPGQTGTPLIHKIRMLRVRAFQGLSPKPELAAEVACVPYDVVNRAEAAAQADGNPLSLMHVDRAEIGLPPETDPYSEAVYAAAKKNLDGLVSVGALVREPVPTVYLYRQQMGGHMQTGVAAVCHIDDYENDIIRKHEKTRKDKEDDRTRLIGALGADTGPVFLTYRGRPEIDAIVAAQTSLPPDVGFVAPDGIRHTLWKIRDAGPLAEAFAHVPLAYVADGHHRSASAARVGRERRAMNPDHTGDEEYNWFLCVLFPADQLRILPYNRVVSDLAGRTPEEFLAKVRETFEVVENAPASPTASGNVSMFIDGRWIGLSWKTDPSADPVARLDVSVLQDRLLAPVLGIDDPRTSRRIDFVGGIRGTSELEGRVNGGRAAVAFSMFPVTVDQLMDIADAGQIMPPKSTWFEPKLRSGLFVHTF